MAQSKAKGKAKIVYAQRGLEVENSSPVISGTHLTTLHHASSNPWAFAHFEEDLCQPHERTDPISGRPPSAA